MVAWPGTKDNMTVDGGGDLVLDDGAPYGSYQEGAQDCGAIDWYIVNAEVKWEQTPASGPQNLTRLRLWIRFSDNGADWSGWIRFERLVRQFRYYDLKAEVEPDLGQAYKVKLTRLEHAARYASREPRQLNVLSTTVLNPVGLTPSMGDRYIINGVGAGDWTDWDNCIAECAESTGPTWVKVAPYVGQKAFDEGGTDDVFYDGTKWRPTRFMQGRKPGGYGVEVDIANAVLQTVVSVTWAAGDYNHDKDQFFIEIKFYGGTNPPIAIPAPAIAIDIYDDVAAAWVQLWTAVVLAQFKRVYRVSVNRAGDISNDIWSADTSSAIPTVVAGAPFPAALISRASGLRVQAMGDTGAKCAAFFYVDRQK